MVLAVDGTLVDSGEAHARSWADALRARGVAIPLERIRPLIGLSAEQLLPRLTGIPFRSPLGHRIDEARALLFRLDHLPALRPFPRAHELLRRMHAEGLRLAAVSAVASADLKRLLEISGALDLVEARLSINHETREPDSIARALHALDVVSEAALMVAGNPYDLAAAARSGLPPIALRCGGWNDRALSGAVAIYEDPADLLERYDHSPLADGSGSESGAKQAKRFVFQRVGAHRTSDRWPVAATPEQ